MKITMQDMSSLAILLIFQDSTAFYSILSLTFWEFIPESMHIPAKLIILFLLNNVLHQHFQGIPKLHQMLWL